MTNPENSSGSDPMALTQAQVTELIVAMRTEMIDAGAPRRIGFGAVILSPDEFAWLWNRRAASLGGADTTKLRDAVNALPTAIRDIRVPSTGRGMMTNVVERAAVLEVIDRILPIPPEEGAKTNCTYPKCCNPEEPKVACGMCDQFAPPEEGEATDGVVLSIPELHKRLKALPPWHGREGGVGIDRVLGIVTQMVAAYQPPASSSVSPDTDVEPEGLEWERVTRAAWAVNPDWSKHERRAIEDFILTVRCYIAQVDPDPTPEEEAEIGKALKPVVRTMNFDAVRAELADLIEEANRSLAKVAAPTPQSDNALYCPLLFLTRALEQTASRAPLSPEKASTKDGACADPDCRVCEEQQ